MTRCDGGISGLPAAGSETTAPVAGQEDDADLFQRMLFIRRFEEHTLQEFARGRVPGTTHACIGQEANAVGVMAAAGGDVIVCSNHRAHGHFLAYGGPADELAAEILGRANGVCGGRGGSQHLHWRDFYSNGVLGGMLPVATGMALAEARCRSGRLVIAFLGEGALGQGVVYESLNLAALWQLPILFVVEDNGWAQTTPLHLALAGNIPARFGAFGIPVAELDTTDVLAIRASAAETLTRVRDGRGPAALVIHTYRLCGHSVRDDVRPTAEVAARRPLDPLLVHGRRLDAGRRARIEEEIAAWIDALFSRVLASPAAAAGAEEFRGSRA